MAVETIGAVTASTLGTSVTPSATAHTKGAWTPLVAASAADARAILVLISGDASSSVENYLVDIGTGGAGSETAVIQNLSHAGPTARLLTPYYLPLPLAAGTRVTARCQCGAAGAGGLRVVAYLLSAQAVDLQACTQVTTYGATPATTRGTLLDPGGTANTKGPWVPIVAASTRPIDWLIPMTDNRGDVTQVACEWFVDVGTGTPGAEAVVVANLQFQATATLDLKVPQCYPAIPIPRVSAGTRVAARAQCNITTAGSRLLGLLLIGADGTPSAGGGGERASTFLGMGG
jgi:hypothetical protein